MRFVFRFSLQIILIAAISLAITGCSGGPPSAQEKIDKMATDLKGKLPKVLDRDTMLVNVYTKKLELVSEYQLINFTPTDTSSSLVKEKINLYLEKTVCPGIKKELLNRGISSRYIYKAKDGQVIVDALLSPGDC